jgi:rhodanese-related sulfurtransferase
MPEQLIEFSTRHSLLVISFAAVFGLIIFNEFRRLTQKFSNIGPAAAIGVINHENAVLLDVREQSETSEGMIADAIHIPLSVFPGRVAEMDKHKDATVIVYCRSGNRSSGACRKLTQRGFEKVYNLSGGIMAWQDAHLPIQKTKKKKK